MALAQPGLGQNNNAPRRMKLGKAHGGRLQNGRSGQGASKRFRIGTRKRFSARRDSIKTPWSTPWSRRRRPPGFRSPKVGPPNEQETGPFPGSKDYYYYDQYEYATTAETEQEPGSSSKDCVPINPTVRVGYWDDVASVTKAVPQLSANDAKAIQQEAMTKKYGQTGRFLMEDGGTTSYEVKSHSLIVREICPGQGSDAVTDYTPEDYVPEEYVPERRNGGKRAAKRRIGGKTKRRNRQQSIRRAKN